MNQPDASATPLKASNPMLRFSERAEDYAKSRPGYPVAAIATILEGLCSASSPLVAADIGAGTGIASRQLAEYGVCVLAIEPDAAMRQAADAHPLIEFREGTAEATHLADNSVDLVTCFQSFHWFDPSQSIKEFHRILKPFGRLALVWSHWDASDEFTASCISLVTKVLFPNPLTRLWVGIRNLAPLPSALIKYWYWLRWRFLNYLPNFTNFRCHQFTFKQELDLSGMIGLVMSQSIVPLSGSVREQLSAQLTQLYERSHTSNGLVSLSYRTTVYLAEPLNF